MYPVNALDMLRRRQERGCCLSLGDPVLDQTCGGGIYTNCITEISGEAGAGKTQFCLVLSLRCHLDRSLGGLGGSAIYLCCGEGAFPDRRLTQLADSLASKYQGHANASTRPITSTEFLNNVHVLSVHHTEQALEVLGRGVPDLCQKQGVRLLIVDSLAGMARTEFDSSQREDMKKRTTALFSLAAKLKWLADTYCLCVVVVNQVTSAGFDPGAAPARGGIGVFSDAQDNKPALGLVWSTCVNTRIMLRRGGGGASSSSVNYAEAEAGAARVVQAPIAGSSIGTENQSTNHNGSTTASAGANGGERGGRVPMIMEPQYAAAVDVSGGRRTLQVEMSPHQAPAACTYKIASDGVFGVSSVWIP